MAYSYGIKNTDPNFVIDPVTRVITQKSGKDRLMQHDHNSECFGFQIPRFIDSHDMSLCSISVHYINISSNKTSRNSDYYPVTDVTVVGENVVFSWLVSKNATEYSGTLNFTIAFNRSTDDVIDYSWHTDIFKGITISETIQNDVSEEVESYSDILTQWENALFGIADTEEASIKSVSATEQEAIEAKGAATLATIPEDYTTLQNQTDSIDRDRAPAIVQTVDGKFISVHDASGGYMRGLKVFGKSIQDGTPTPDAPVDIVSVGAVDVSVRGTNLVDLSATPDQLSEEYTFDADSGLYSCSSGTAHRANRWCLKVPKNTRLYMTADHISDNVHIQLSDFIQTGSTTIEEFITSDSLKVVFDTGDMDELTVSIFCISEITPPLQVYGLRVGIQEYPYESYVGETLSSEIVLPGIPVTSDGNYTDEDGQQWICDEIDFERGVYVKRINVAKLSGAVVERVEYPDGSGRYRFNMKRSDNPSFERSSSSSIGMCSALTLSWDPISLNEVDQTIAVYDLSGGIYARYDAMLTADDFASWATQNDVEVVYPLATPTETALTEAELTAFKALRTNYPNTIVLNDAGAHMQLKYNADTKLYIDNKFAELAAKLNSGT